MRMNRIPAGHPRFSPGRPRPGPELHRIGVIQPGRQHHRSFEATQSISKCLISWARQIEDHIEPDRLDAKPIQAIDDNPPERSRNGPLPKFHQLGLIQQICCASLVSSDIVVGQQNDVGGRGLHAQSLLKAINRPPGQLTQAGLKTNKQDNDSTEGNRKHPDRPSRSTEPGEGLHRAESNPLHGGQSFSASLNN